MVIENLAGKKYCMQSIDASLLLDISDFTLIEDEKRPKQMGNMYHYV